MTFACESCGCGEFSLDVWKLSLHIVCVECGNDYYRFIDSPLPDTATDDVLSVGG